MDYAEWLYMTFKRAHQQYANDTRNSIELIVRWEFVDEVDKQSWRELARRVIELERERDEAEIPY